MNSLLSGRSTEDIVKSYINGNKKAFAELHDCYSGKLYKKFRRKGIEHNLAEDLLQILWLRVLLALPRFEWSSEGEFRSWLYRISGQVINRHLLKRSSTEVSSDTSESVADDGMVKGSAATMALATLAVAEHAEMENADEFWATLSLLNQDDQELLIWRLVDGLTLEEIAARRGCSVPTISDRLKLIYNRLRVLLD